MTNAQENYYLMLKSVSSFLAANSDVTSTMPVFDSIIQKLDGKINEIKDLDAERENMTSGIATDKKKERDELEKMLFKVSSITSLYGRLNNKQNLVEAYDLSSNDIYSFRDIQLLQVSQALINDVSPELDNMADYGMTQEILDSLINEREDFDKVVNTSDKKRAERKTATKSLKTLFREAREILENELDKVVDIFRDSEATFFDGYYNSRNIIDRGIRHKAQSDATVES
ncbi:MAG: hypothetical protein PVH88_18825 [Ignavibacteria bacterium]|jgi:hypothetical protein